MNNQPTTEQKGWNKTKTMAAVVFGVIILAAFASWDAPADTTPEAPTATAAVSPEPKEEPAPATTPASMSTVFYSNFMDGCMGESSKASCQCMYDYLIDTYGLPTVLERVSTSEEEMKLLAFEAAYACYE